MGKHNGVVSSGATKLARIASEIGAGVVERQPALPLPIWQLVEIERGEKLECHSEQQLMCFLIPLGDAEAEKVKYSV